MEDCIFCSIVDNVTATSAVYSDERILAFMDVQPVNPGHVLVIPRGHAPRLAELDEEMGVQLFRVAMQVAQGLRRSELKVEVVNLHLVDGEATGQEVPHVHLHVIPSFRGNGFGISARDYGFRPDRKELDAAVLRIRLATP